MKKTVVSSAPAATQTDEKKSRPQWRLGKRRAWTPRRAAVFLDAYFSDERNKPFSILEICAEMGIGRETWSQWERDEQQGFAELAEQAKLRCGAAWEKGQGVPQKMAELLLKNYFGYADRAEIAVNEQVSVDMGDIPTLEAIQARLNRLPLTHGRAVAEDLDQPVMKNVTPGDFHAS